MHILVLSEFNYDANPRIDTNAANREYINLNIRNSWISIYLHN
jgi:hypothetical protein